MSNTEKVFIESLGDVYVCGLTVGRQEEMYEKTGEREIEELGCEEFIKNILQFTYSKDEDEKVFLTESDVENLSSDEKELLISKLLEYDDYLFRETKTIKRKDENGNESVEFVDGDIVYPRKEEESVFDYYYRLNILQEEKNKESLKKMVGKLNFSKGLNNQISNVFKNFSGVQGAMSHFNKQQEILGKLSRPVQNFPKIKPLEIPKVNDQSDEFKIDYEVLRDHKLDALNELIEKSEKQTLLMAESLTVTTRMLSELKDSSNQAKSATRQNILFTIIVIGISILGVYATYQTSNSSTIDLVKPLESIKFQLEVNGVKETTKLEKLVKLLESSINQSKKTISNLEEQLKHIKNNKPINTDTK